MLMLEVLELLELLATTGARVSARPELLIPTVEPQPSVLKVGCEIPQQIVIEDPRSVVFRPCAVFPR